jgi:hypothetical protein
MVSLLCEAVSYYFISLHLALRTVTQTSDSARHVCQPEAWAVKVYSSCGGKAWRFICFAAGWRNGCSLRFSHFTFRERVHGCHYCISVLVRPTAVLSVVVGQELGCLSGNRFRKSYLRWERLDVRLTGKSLLSWNNLYSSAFLTRSCY